jgi:hypothetical protein
MYFRRVILAEKYRTKGPWEIEWSIYVDNIIDAPKIEENKLIFKVRQVRFDASLIIYQKTVYNFFYF